MSCDLSVMKLFSESKKKSGKHSVYMSGIEQHRWHLKLNSAHSRTHSFPVEMFHFIYVLFCLFIWVKLRDDDQLIHREASRVRGSTVLFLFLGQSDLSVILYPANL